MRKFAKSILLLTCILSLQLIKPTASLYANTMTLTYDGKQHTYSKPPISLEIDNQKIEMTMPPVQIDGSTLVPTRQVFEPMGATVEWKSAEKKVFINHGDQLIVLEVDNQIAWIEGVSETLDVPPKIINNNLMLPLRFIGETLGFKVDWDHKTSHISINQMTKVPEVPSVKPPIVEAPKLQTTVEQVRVSNQDDGSALYTIQLAKPVGSYTHFIHDGKVVVDIDSAKNALASNITLDTNPYVEKVRTSQYKPDQTRVVFDMNQAVKSVVELSRDKMSINIILRSNQEGQKTPEPVKPEPIKPEPVRPEQVKPEQIKPEEVKPENIALRNIEYLYSPRESIVLKKAPGLSASNISVNDDYRNRKLTITLPENYRDLYPDTELKVGSHTIDKVVIKSTNKTEIIVHEKKIREYEIIEENDYIRIIFMDPKEKHEKIILLDMGHGAQDAGASANGLTEKKLNLDQGLEIYKMLERNPNIKVYVTREDDSYPSNSSRAKLANDIGADIFVSLHHNSFTSPSANGTEVLYSTKSPKSKQMAEIIQRNMVSSLGTFNRGTKARPGLVVLNSTQMPAVLVETAFISNPGDIQKLKSPEFNQKAAAVIYDSIVEIFNTISFR